MPEATSTRVMVPRSASVVSSVPSRTRKVVKPESYAAMTTPLVLKDGRDTGYGFGLMKSEAAGKLVILHGGGIHGFNSQLLHVVPDDLHVAVISNCTQASADRLARDIVRKIEESMTYPGQIKVTVIRETRAVEYAK